MLECVLRFVCLITNDLQTALSAAGFTSIRMSSPSTSRPFSGYTSGHSWPACTENSTTCQLSSKHPAERVYSVMVYNAEEMILGHGDGPKKDVRRMRRKMQTDSPIGPLCEPARISLIVKAESRWDNGGPDRGSRRRAYATLLPPIARIKLDLSGYLSLHLLSLLHLF